MAGVDECPLTKRECEVDVEEGAIFGEHHVALVAIANAQHEHAHERADRCGHELSEVFASGSELICQIDASVLRTGQTIEFEYVDILKPPPHQVSIMQVVGRSSIDILYETSARMFYRYYLVEFVAYDG